MCASGNELFCRCIALVAIVLLLPAPAWSQWDASRPGRLAPLTSGPAAIPLVATLESLSVSALPCSLPISASLTRVAPALTVTTAWTIRSNRTILRLSGYSGTLAAFERDPLSVSPLDKTVRLSLHASTAVPANETDWPGIAQPVGPASHPGSRTDNVEFAVNRSDNSSAARTPSPVYILAQAF
jgi:hypothetical protein